MLESFCVPRPMPTQAPFAAFHFLSHCLCVSGTLKLVAWAPPCIYPIPPLCRSLIFNFVCCVCYCWQNPGKFHSYLQELAEDHLFMLTSLSSSFKVPAYCWQWQAAFNLGLWGQGFGSGPWPHYPVRPVFRAGCSRASSETWLLGRAGQGMAGVK